MSFLNSIMKKIEKVKDHVSNRASIANLLIASLLIMIAIIGPILVFTLFTIYNFFYAIFFLPKYIKYNIEIKKSRDEKQKNLNILLDSSFIDSYCSKILRKDIVSIFKEKSYIFMTIQSNLQRFLFTHTDMFEEFLKEKQIAKYKEEDFQSLDSVEKQYISSENVPFVMKFVNLCYIQVKEKRNILSKEVLWELKYNEDLKNLEILFQRYFGHQIWNYQLVQSLKQQINFELSQETTQLVSGNFDQISMHNFCTKALELFSVIEFNLDNQTFLSKLHPSLRTQDQFKKLEEIFQTYLKTKNLSLFYYHIKISEMENHCIFFKIYQEWTK